MFSLVYTGDFASYYLAVLNGIDPTPVDRITFLKRELSKIR
ncbi:MAG: SIS domain-containing protein [Candidatus Omnitrophica bacterium]|nr:SIS domain-containing protein [Candidatus Omnitrophota bacterium]